jgi:uncharacterized membrane protein YeiH
VDGGTVRELSTATLLFTLDLIGTFVFALRGSASGVKNKLDPFGVGVLAFVARPSHIRQ